MERGIDDNWCPDLMGEGLVRSAGGWSVVKVLRKGIERVKEDERIVGDGALFVNVLKAAQEYLERKSQLQADSDGFEWLVDYIAQQLRLEREDLLVPGRYSQDVKARSLLCYWGTRIGDDDG
jgi:putative transposase